MDRNGEIPSGTRGRIVADPVFLRNLKHLFHDHTERAGAPDSPVFLLCGGSHRPPKCCVYLDPGHPTDTGQREVRGLQ